MPTTIKVKRGLETNRNSVTPAAGEFLFTTDNKKLFIGDGTTAGGVSVGGAVAFEQSIKAVDYTLVLSDAGKQIFHPASDAAVRTYTIPANASVPFPIGTVLQFAVDPSGFDVNVAINSDTLVLGSGQTGTVRVDPGNILTAIKITATKWLANYEYQFPYVSPERVAVSELSTGGQYFNLYSWTSSGGFGTRYSTPGTAVLGNYYGIRIAPNGSAIAMAHTGTPFVSAFALNASGYGAKFSNPATLPTGQGNDVAWHPAMNAIAVAHNTSPYITAYPWSSSGFGTKYTNPSTLPVGLNCTGVAFSPAGNAVAVSTNGSPYIEAYAWDSSTGFGTKYANPATLPGAAGTRCAFNPAGDAIAVSYQTSPYVNVYPWNASTGFGAKFSNPATLPAGIAYDVAFSPNGGAIAVAHGTAPFVTAYPWSGSGFGTKYSNPGSASVAAPGRGVAFSTPGNAIFVCGDTTPFIEAWSWSDATGFGTKYGNPASLPSGAAQKVDSGFI